jgi:hypothetical protein
MLDTLRDVFSERELRSIVTAGARGILQFEREKAPGSKRQKDEMVSIVNEI